MVLEYLEIQNKLVQAFAFQSVRHESGIFRFECIKACLRHDLNQPTRIMKSRLAIKFPTPNERSNACPGKTKVIKFPPSWAGKDVKCPGYARGGMFKLRFDR